MNQRTRQRERTTSLQLKAAPMGHSIDLQSFLGKMTREAPIAPSTVDELRSMARAMQRLWRSLKMSPDGERPTHEEHSHHTAEISLMIARRLKLSQPMTDRIYRAAYLHDVGGIAVAGAILDKRGKLTRQERGTMQAHAAIGAELLGAFLSSKDLAKVAVSHHERYDGHGYPYGLAGTRIPLEARVLTIADSIDAMTSARPYRQKPLSVAAAWRAVVGEAGRQFDPAMIEDLVKRRKSDGLGSRR